MERDLPERACVCSHTRGCFHVCSHAHVRSHACVRAHARSLLKVKKFEKSVN